MSAPRPPTRRQPVAGALVAGRVERAMVPA
ncbi:hypothetical protein FHR93_002127 [Geodermatophilus sabuli]|nr:hypothetical protein [Geodermatophilus sabuli]